MATTGMGRSTRGIWAKRLAAAVAVAALGLTACSKEEEPEKSAVELAVERNAEYYKNAASDNGGDEASDGGEAGGFTMPPENEGILPPDRADYPGTDTETDEGAEQTVKFFFDAKYYGYATGDTEPLQSVSRSDCKQCSITIKDIQERTQDRGEFILGHSNEPQSLGVITPDWEGFTSIYYAFFEGSLNRRLPDGTSQTYPARNMHSASHVIYERGQWYIAEIGWAEDDDA